MDILEFLIAVLTGLICWQNIFSNNVVLFKVRLELYKRFTEIYHRYLNIVERFNNLSVQQLVESVQEGNVNAAIINKQIFLITEFSKLESIISEMVLMDFNAEIISQLDNIMNQSTLICDYLVGTREGMTQPSKEQFDTAVKTLKINVSKNSTLDHLFKKDLALRNFKYYRRHIERVHTI